MTSPHYLIPEYTLINERIKFEVHVFGGNRTTYASIASLTLNPLVPHQIADISDGISIMSIGRKSGQFQLTANVSAVQRDRIIGYQWSCHYSDSQQPCREYSNTTKLLINKQIQNRPQLTLDSNVLHKTKHIFGLHVLYKNDLENTFYNTFTTINVNDENAPQILFGSVYIRQKSKLIHRTMSSNVIIVPARTPIIVKGIIKNLESDSIGSIEWFLSESIFELQWSNRFINDQIHSELHLHRGQCFQQIIIN